MADENVKNRMLQEKNPSKGRMPAFPAQFFDKDGYPKLVNEENPLPSGNYVMTDGGVWVPQKGDEDGNVNARLTGSNVEDGLLTRRRTTVAEHLKTNDEMTGGSIIGYGENIRGKGRADDFIPFNVSGKANKSVHVKNNTTKSFVNCSIRFYTTDEPQDTENYFMEIPIDNLPAGAERTINQIYNAEITVPAVGMGWFGYIYWDTDTNGPIPDDFNVDVILLGR